MNNLDAEQYLGKLSNFADTLIREASEIQQNINNAKTATKREYYSKKMKKVSRELQRVLATSQLVKLSTQKPDADTSEQAATA